MTCRILQIRTIQDWRQSSAWLCQRSQPDPAVENAVRAIIDQVRSRGDAALIDYTRQFDCPDFAPPLAVGRDEIDDAMRRMGEEQLKNIADAAANIRAFHEAQREKSWFVSRPDGSILGQRVIPVDVAGLYVPGGKSGKTPLVSSLLMNAIPAQVAGCSRIAMATPPGPDGHVNPGLLAAAGILGLDEIYRVGGAWSVAALAFGTESVPRADVIAGPGNIHVATAKKLLQGQVGIDMIAGPSEVLVLADSSANPRWVAADMLSQAEHDSLASAICLTDDAELAREVAAALAEQLRDLPRREIAQKSLLDWGCIAVLPGLELMLEIANIIAPEHLELCLRDPWSALPGIKHAGAVFLGNYSPEPLGDYFAGPNHVLPTLGTARFSSPLSVDTFCKKTNIICSSRAFQRESAPAVANLARLEGLEAHARSMEIRRQTSAH